jgi:hypothetical protein
MAELNFGLLTPPGSQSIGNAFAQGMDQAAVARAQENQNALAQYTLGKAKREDELTNQLLGDLRNAKTPEEIYSAYRRVGKPEVASKMQSEALTQDELRGKILAQPGVRARTDAQTAQLQSEAKSKAIAEVASLPDAASANAAIDTRLANKTIDQSMADEMRQGLTPENFPTWKHTTLMRLSTPVEQLKQSVVTTKDTDRGGFIERQAYNAQGVAVGAPTILPKTPTPGSVPGLTQAAVAVADAQDRGLPVSGVAPAQGTPGAAPAPAGAPVTPGAFPRITPQVQTQRNNAQIALLNAELSQPVNSNPADQQRIRAEIAKLSTGDPFAKAGANPLPVVNNMPGAAAAAAAPTVNAMTAPSAREIRDARAKGYAFNSDGTMSPISGGPADKTVVTRTPVQEVRFRKDLATDYTTTTATTQGMQDVLDSITDVRNSPGLAGATGISGMVYSFPNSQAAAAETNLANLKGKVTSLGQTLANASGKIGPMALQEWTIVRDMVAALDKAVSKGEKITLDEIGKIEFAAKNVAKRVQDKFEGQYGDELSNYPQFATVPKPKSRIKPAAIPQAAIDALNAGIGTPAQFDAQFGAGAAARAQGKK